MKLHIHQAYRNGQRFHAYTRDKSGKLLKTATLFEENGDETVFSKRDWTYFRPLNFERSDPNAHGQQIYEVLLRNGVCIAKIHKYPSTIFVFDAKFDQANARIYSLDEDLSSFHGFFGDLKLSSKGDVFGYDEIEFKGSISDKYYFEIGDLGVDLNQIDKTNFSIVFSENSIGEIEYHRRFLQRKLREDIPKIVNKKFGMELTELRIDSLTFTPTDLNIEAADKAGLQDQELVTFGSPLKQADTLSGSATPPRTSLPGYDDLKAQFIALADLAPHPRGYAFQKFLYGVFEAHGTNPRSSFRNRGEEIDGSFSLAGHPYLLEAKWEAEPVGAAALHVFEGKLTEKAPWARGLFISYAGFSSDGLAAFGRAKRTLCMDGQDLLEMLSQKLSLEQVLDAKGRRAAETGLPFVKLRDLF